MVSLLIHILNGLGLIGGGLKRRLGRGMSLQVWAWGLKPSPAQAWLRP